VVLVPENAASHFSGLMQYFSAAPFRGGTVRLRAWLRLEISDSQDSGQLWLRVDRAQNLALDQDLNGRDCSVTSARWTRCEIQTHVGDDATFIEFGVNLTGRGQVWVDDVSFEVVPR
jgi:hypothetical protein